MDLHLRENDIRRTMVADMQARIKAIHEQRDKLRSDLQKMHDDHVSQVEQLLAENSHSKETSELEAFIKGERKRHQIELETALKFF